jgi:dTDP-4-dehydrorhamnose 3,5-epimerase
MRGRVVIFTATEIEGVCLIDVEPIVDDRGFFARAWCRDEFAARGLFGEIAQASIAFTAARGTLRGLHCQLPPHEETKLVRCTRGAAFVVAVDLRPDSPTHARWVGAELTMENRRMLYVPKGCAQGYQTLVDDTEMLYQMSVSYKPEAAGGVRYDDPAFSIPWPLEVRMLSSKDRAWPMYEVACR